MAAEASGVNWAVVAVVEETKAETGEGTGATVAMVGVGAVAASVEEEGAKRILNGGCKYPKPE